MPSVIALVVAVVACVVFAAFGLWVSIMPPYICINAVNEIEDLSMTAAQLLEEIKALDAKIRYNERISKVSALFSFLMCWPSAFYTQNKYLDTMYMIRARRERLVDLYSRQF